MLFTAIYICLSRQPSIHSQKLWVIKRGRKHWVFSTKARDFPHLWSDFLFHLHSPCGHCPFFSPHPCLAALGQLLPLFPSPAVHGTASSRGAEGMGIAPLPCHWTSFPFLFKKNNWIYIFTAHPLFIPPTNLSGFPLPSLGKVLHPFQLLEFHTVHMKPFFLRFQRKVLIIFVGKTKVKYCWSWIQKWRAFHFGWQEFWLSKVLQIQLACLIKGWPGKRILTWTQHLYINNQDLLTP